MFLTVVYDCCLGKGLMGRQAALLQPQVVHMPLSGVTGDGS